MQSKTILMIMDGLGDRPIPAFNGQTPLEAADTPHLDQLAGQGICGIMDSLEVGMRPGSDTSHMSLFGYDPFRYYRGRGPFEVLGLGMDLLEGDVAFRANLATVTDGIITDRRAGRIKNGNPFIDAINGLEIDGITFLLQAGKSHRAGLVMRGRGLSDFVTDNDPTLTGRKAMAIGIDEPGLSGLPEPDRVAERERARFTAGVLQQYLDQAARRLHSHPENRKRAAAGKLQANLLLVRGAGMPSNLPSFSERYGLNAVCIAAGSLYRGVARSMGMPLLDVAGATGGADSNISGKVDCALQALREADFVFLHIKGTDPFGHDGDFEGKKAFIEKVDRALKPLLNSDILVIVTADHSTPCSLKDHSGDPVPLLMRGPGVRTDECSAFGERPCARGGLHRIRGIHLMQEIRNLLALQPIFGA